MQPLLDFSGRVFLGNSLANWLLALAAFLATFLVVPFVRGRIRARRQKSVHYDTPALDLLARLAARTSGLVMLSVALYLAQKVLVLPDAVGRAFDVIIVFGVAVQGALWGVTALRFGIERHYGRAGDGTLGTSAVVGVLLFLGQVLVWALFTLLALDNLGVNITALVAGLGIGGIAIALAVQTILGDLLASMSIALDKPFAVGDQLRVDDIEGTVEQIGIKSTRLRALTGEQVVLSNADLLKSRLHNLGRMVERRALFRFGVTYETPPAKLDAVAQLVRRAVESVPHTRFLQCPLIALGADSLEFEPIFFVVNRPDVGFGVTIGAVNQAIFREITAAGIDFAYPTRRLLLEQAAPGADSAPVSP